MHLLDVNILIARADTSHPHHQLTKDWMYSNTDGWATCAITENGLLRILGNPKYPGNGAQSPRMAALALKGMISSIVGHRFLAENLSLLTPSISLNGVTPAQLTDIYLLALALKHQAKFLTLDHRINTDRVPGGATALTVLS